MEAFARIGLDGRCPVCDRDCFDVRCPDSHYAELGIPNSGRDVVVGTHPCTDHPQNK